MDAKQAKLKNIIDMAFAFSAMTRVFEKNSTEKIVSKLASTLLKINTVQGDADFRILHDDFCNWFEHNIKTADRRKKEALIKHSGQTSYGQGAKVLNCALKVYIYYCNLPEDNVAKRIIKWLDAAIDTKMMKYLKRMPENKGKAITATAIEHVDKNTYLTLQELVRNDILRSFSGNIYPVQWDDVMFRKLNNKDNSHNAENNDHKNDNINDKMAVDSASTGKISTLNGTIGSSGKGKTGAWGITISRGSVRELHKKHYPVTFRDGDKITLFHESNEGDGFEARLHLYKLSANSPSYIAKGSSPSDKTLKEFLESLNFNHGDQVIFKFNMINKQILISTKLTQEY